MAVSNEVKGIINKAISALNATKHGDLELKYANNLMQRNDAYRVTIRDNRILAKLRQANYVQSDFMAEFDVLIYDSYIFNKSLVPLDSAIGIKDDMPTRDKAVIRCAWRILSFYKEWLQSLLALHPELR